MSCGKAEQPQLASTFFFGFPSAKLRLPLFFPVTTPGPGVAFPIFSETPIFFSYFWFDFFPHLSGIRFGTKTFPKNLEKIEQKLGNHRKGNKKRRKQMDQDMQKQKRHKTLRGPGNPSIQRVFNRRAHALPKRVSLLKAKSIWSG